MSSIRKMTPPRRERMESQASRYVRALPMCWAPVGDGARRPVGIRSLVIDALVSCESAGAQRQGRPRVYDIRLANKNKTDNTCLNKYLRVRQGDNNHDPANGSCGDGRGGDRRRAGGGDGEHVDCSEGA